ncbi:MAG: chloride channel protein [Rhodospirillaceae bacterium]|nr:chloride channel protein [Rhodospirillaceae bacterium]
MEKTEEEGHTNYWMLGLFALIVGVVTGCGAVVFRSLITIVHNILFYGEFSWVGQGNAFETPSAWGPLVILVPVIGGMGVVFLVRTFAPEAKGHGVPEVMDAIYYREGRIRPVVAFVKSVASALSIGSGASVGREGPIIQIGASLGSTLGQLARIPTWQRITLVAAGAGAGIAATFNTPLGAVMFAIELMMPEFSTRTFLPVVVATGSATYIGRLAYGLDPAFAVPVLDPGFLHPIHLSTLAGFVVLGLLCGVAAWAFVRLLTAMEDYFEGSFWSKRPYLSHAVGMLVLGLMMYGLHLGFGHYFIDGVGYGTIQSILQGDMTWLGLLALLFVAKLVATTLSLGSGASGGVFSPSLFMGATLGAAFGALLLPMLPETEFTIPDFAAVGMASMVAAGTGAAMTAIVMIFEMTRDYNIIVPMILAVSLGIGVRRLLSKENIYTIKLAWRGKRIPRERHSNMFLVRHAEEVMTRSITVMPADKLLREAVEELHDLPPDKRITHIIVDRDGHVAGVVALRQPMGDLQWAVGDTTLGEIGDDRYVLTRPDESMFVLFQRFSRGRAERALVVRGEGVPRIDDVVGVISKRLIADAVLKNFTAYST